MSKHTPGPWIISNSGTGVCGPHQESQRHGVIASCDAIARARAENEANARLIAAAPDLLAACQAIIANPYGCPFCDSGVLRTPGNPAKDHDDDCAYVLIRAAIEKAGQR